jgi:hypothetical protein
MRGGGLVVHTRRPKRQADSQMLPKRFQDHQNRALVRQNTQWARRVSNLRPLACEASALPLSYAP